MRVVNAAELKVLLDQMVATSKDSDKVATQIAAGIRRVRGRTRNTTEYFLGQRDGVAIAVERVLRLIESTPESSLVRAEDVARELEGLMISPEGISRIMRELKTRAGVTEGLRGATLVQSAWGVVELFEAADRGEGDLKEVALAVADLKRQLT